MAVPYIFATVLGGTSIPLSQLDANFAYLANNGTFTGTASFQNITASGTLGVTGNTTLGGTLSVTGASTLTGNVTMAGNLDVAGTFKLAGTTISGFTGTGNFVLANTPTLVTPILGTPTSGTLTNCTGLPISTGVSGLGTGVATALAVNIGSAGAPIVYGGALGGPSSGTLTNCTGLPVSTGITGFGTGVATFLATPSSANLATAVTDETGSGALVFANTPTLVTPNIGAATGTSLAATGLIKSSSSSAGIGYATGAGSTVTQGTSRTTGVTINAVSGAITLVSAAGSATAASFTVTNSAVAATDVIILNQKSGTDKYDLLVTTVAAGSFEITFRTTSGTTTEQPVINFAVIKAVAA